MRFFILFCIIVCIVSKSTFINQLQEISQTIGTTNEIRQKLKFISNLLSKEVFEDTKEYLIKGKIDLVPEKQLNLNILFSIVDQNQLNDEIKIQAKLLSSSVAQKIRELYPVQNIDFNQIFKDEHKNQQLEAIVQQLIDHRLKESSKNNRQNDLQSQFVSIQQSIQSILSKLTPNQTSIMEQLQNDIIQIQSNTFMNYN